MASKVVILTGASSGIGAALAPVLVARGHRVVLAARRQSELAAVAAPLGDSAITVVADVTKRADNERLRAAALEKWNQVDTFIANAGRGISAMPSELTDEDIDDMVATNLKSVVYGYQSVLAAFKAKRHGHFIAVSSMLGKLPLAPMRSAYSAMKAAVNSIVGSLRGELREEFPAIHASVYLPGVVATPFGTNARGGGPDSRALPQAMPVETAAQQIADLVEAPRAEAYSAPPLHELAGRYYSAPDVADVERLPPFNLVRRA